jgi:hypothetical protein
MTIRGQLQQINAVNESVKTRALRIKGEGPNRGEIGEKLIDGVDRIEVQRSRGRHGYAKGTSIGLREGKFRHEYPTTFPRGVRVTVAVVCTL